MSQIDSLLQQARDSGLRRTKALEALFTCLAEHNRPMTLAELSSCGHLSSKCDKATVFRLLQRLCEKGMARRLGLHERAAYFTLLLPGIHRDYLICTDCGSIDPVDAPCPVHQLEEEIREETGFTELYHELEFFGRCPKCSASS
ncbi:MAG: transcriptional repressor [Akkermansiaceae bacterium]|mgnify:FL=1|nr:transcriptional repressor [Akkermansiaceae bacterium]MDB4623813.1 transcriptional repressor [Akkermansiaceae bacterium]MDB4730762.1 transcriptional repressor [Akkermansiaceae bacterium]MDB4754462.1 transcriptional repressor [Akkermansiaceae bacterium]MDG1070236.1 transcriptional repressor [Akkermansiaceae bacterium]